MTSTLAFAQPVKPGPVNTLSEAEKNEGFALLFDGKTTKGWRGVYLDHFPEHGWVVADGVLSHEKAAGGESNSGGDVVSEGEYSDFILSLEWRISPGGNSGIKYFVTEAQPKPAGSAIGLEYQILDDALHPDAKKGIDGNRTAAGLYDLIAPPKDKKVNPVGSWNHAVIIAKGSHVEHWLNGEKTVEYDRSSPAFDKLVAGSKYKDMVGFGHWPKGHILLQDHGDAVAFRSIKIKVLSK